MLSFVSKNNLKRFNNLIISILFITIQLGAAAVPFIFTSTASAANEISVADHEGQQKPAGTYTNGNVTTYTELDSVNYRFDIDSSSAASGKMQVEFTSNDTGCLFYDGSFNLGTHDSSAPTLTNVVGTAPVVTKFGAATNNGSDWIQVLDVSFAGSGSATINYYLTLTNEAGECSSGSPQHSRLSNAPNGGGFKNIGQQNVPIPSSKIIELPEIFIQKWVDTNADGTVDRKATAGEWSFSLDGGTPVATDANGNVTFMNVTPNGNHTVTESGGPAGQSFLSGSGTNCTFSGATATANVASGETAQDATCIFNNGVRPGSITIIKDAKPNRAQDFSFSATGTGLPANFLLDDDTNATLSNQLTVNNLSAGSYSVTEAAASGWDLKSLICTGGSTQNTGSKVDITLAAGQNVICTFTNVKRASITVNKVTNPVSQPDSFPITISGSGTINGSASGNLTTAQPVVFDVSEGSYSVSEQVPSGWVETSNTCNPNNLNIVVTNSTTDAELAKSCTITNTKNATINIIKNALPNNAQDFSFLTTLPGGNFSLDDDSGATGEDNILSSQKSFTNLAPSTAYSVTENSTPGWELTRLVCDSGSFSALGSVLSVTPAPGQTINCTFTNTKYGLISGYKYEVNADNSTVGGLQNWTINLLLGGNAYSTTTTDEFGFYIFDSLLPGGYSVEEEGQAGYTQLYPNPNTIAVDLDAGEQSANNNFGNFENAAINGFKWNDLNGNGDYDNDNEPKLDGWKITLYNDDNDADSDLNNKVTETDTANGGNYSFGNLAPGNYAVCETAQAGWIQTYPLNPSCHIITIDQSGETNQANFGNQGRGTVTVIKNVDSDGNGTVDQTNAADWTWDIDGAGNFATGSGNARSVAAGNYTISEDQKQNYHVTSSSCSGETPPAQPSTSVSATVSPGENVTCTFVNTRDTGTLKLIKHVVNDDGGTAEADDFNLHVKQNGNDALNSPAAGSESGTIYSLTTGTYDVSEDSPPAGYTQTSIVCDGQQTSSVPVTTNTEKVCTITNNDNAPGLTLVKQVVNDNSGNSVAADWTLTADPEIGDTISGNSPVNSSADANTAYSLSESGPTGYHLKTDWSCDGGTFDDQANTITLALDEDVTCTIVNDDDAHPAIQIVKSGPAAAHEGDQVAYSFSVDNIGDEPLANVQINDPLISNIVFVSGDTSDDGILDVDETWQYTANYTIPGNQIADVVNKAQVCADPRVGEEVCADDDHTTDILHPSITVVKSGPALAYEDQQVGYTFVVTNTGDTTLSDVNIDDDIAINETCDKSTLAPNESTNCTAIYLIPIPTADNVINNVDACGTDPLQLEVCDDDSHELDVIHPGIQVIKTGPTQAHEGDQVTYTFNVTNTGDVPLSNVMVNDNLAGTAAYVSGDTNTDDKLDLGETWIFTGNYEIPNEQTNDVVNTATACGLDPIQSTQEEGDPVCDDDNHTLDVLHPSLNVVKTGPASASPGDTITYTFTVTNTGDTPLSGTTAADSIAGGGAYQSGDTNDNDLLDLTETWIFTVQYTIPSDQDENIDNTVLVCAEDELEGKTCDDDTHRLVVLARVIVTKYNDLDRDGTFDPNENSIGLPEPTLPGWEFNLKGEKTCQEPVNNLFDALLNVICQDYNYDKTQTTGDDGKSAFTEVMPGVSHQLRETLQEGWNLSGIDCGERQGSLDGETYFFSENSINAGETVNCFVGNYQDIELLLAKSNNRPNPTFVGDTVTYTLTATLPEDNGVLYNTAVTDLPPENFEYVPGSWTASSNVRGDIKAEGTTTEPTYASPGQWALGTMIPGEIVTLTYRAVIGSSVSAGTYPDLAFASGCGVNGESCLDEEVVLSNSNVAQDPFVGTRVTISLAAATPVNRTVLVNTGTSYIWLYSIFAAILMIGGFMVARSQSTPKGGRK